MIPTAMAVGMALALGGPPTVHADSRAAVPDTVSSPVEIVRLLASPGTREEGRAALMALVPTLDGDRATLWLGLLATVDRTGPAASAVAARAVLAADTGDVPAGVNGLERALGGEEISETDRPPLLSLAAHLADRMDRTRAAILRKRLEDQFPDAPEAPEARLLRARFLLTDPATVPAAMELLEDMLVRTPGHVLAPEARRLRQEAGRGGGEDR